MGREWYITKIFKIATAREIFGRFIASGEIKTYSAILSMYKDLLMRITIPFVNSKYQINK